MNNDLTWQALLIDGLACFRLAVLLAEDAGPAHMFTRLRSWLKREARAHPAVRKSAVHEGIECLRCNSVWIAYPVAIYALFYQDGPKWVVMVGDLFLLSMALSAIAILFQRMFPKR